MNYFSGPESRGSDPDLIHAFDPFHPRLDNYAELTSRGSIRKFKFLLLGGRPMVGLQTLDLAIGVRVPASQPHCSIYCLYFSLSSS